MEIIYIYIYIYLYIYIYIYMNSSAEIVEKLNSDTHLRILQGALLSVQQTQ